MDGKRSQFGWKPEDVGSKGIFVFGSNLAGIHGAGAARFAACNYGAIKGLGEGLWGRSYAIPTKDRSINTRKLDEINKSVIRFIDLAKKRHELVFYVTPIGCGLAGYKYEQIAPMFRRVPGNVILPIEFEGLNE